MGIEEFKSIQINMGNRFDEFNDDFIFTLTNEDTLAIQENYILFE